MTNVYTCMCSAYSVQKQYATVVMETDINHHALYDSNIVCVYNNMQRFIPHPLPCSSFDEYATEVKSGRLEWSSVHRSDKFWVSFTTVHIHVHVHVQCHVCS